MGKLFINDFEYELEFVKLLKENIYHFSILQPTKNIIHLETDKQYMCTIQYNGEIIDLGEELKIHKGKKSQEIYFVGENIHTSVCFKIEKTNAKKKYLFPMFASLELSYFPDS